MSIFGVRFHALGQTEYYSVPDGCKPGDQVLIEADQGLALGEIVTGLVKSLPGFSEQDLAPILRLANAEDKETGQKNIALAQEAMHFCRERIQARRLDMKLVDVEVYFDCSKFIFYFTAPARIDFRELVKDLVREYRARIELRQIGVRHETQMLGAVGNCGMVCCCRRYLRKFAPVTIRMAKEQNLFLNPAKISGICGRLLCCLSYEQENYERFHRNSPRPGKRYQTSKGILKVVRVNMFRNALSALTEDNEEIELSLEEWQSLAPRRPDITQASQASMDAPGLGNTFLRHQTSMQESSFDAEVGLESLLDEDGRCQAGENDLHQRKPKPHSAAESESKSQNSTSRHTGATVKKDKKYGSNGAELSEKF